MTDPVQPWPPSPTGNPTPPKPAPQPAIEEKEIKMSTTNPFVNVLDKVGDALKWFFTNKTVEAVEQGGIEIAEVAFPALTPLLSGIGKSLATAQGLASAVNISGDTTSQVTAIVLADAQQVFQAYQAATGTTLETAQQQAIIQAFINLLSIIPGSTQSMTPTGTTTVINQGTNTLTAPGVTTGTVHGSSIL